MIVNFINKVKLIGVTPPNILCWLSLKIMDLWGKFWGTLRLRIKSYLLGVNIGTGTIAYGTVSLLRWPGGKIKIGSHVSLISSWRRATASALAWPIRLRVFGQQAAIEIDDGAQLSGTSITARSKTIKIGKNVLIGPNCVIIDSDFHAPWPAAQRATSPGYENDASVEIHDFCWIGMNSIILKGVTIGEGSIIGAGSVVSRNIPPNSVACGNPCKVIHTMEKING